MSKRCVSVIVGIAATVGIASCTGGDDDGPVDHPGDTPTPPTPTSVPAGPITDAVLTPSPDVPNVARIAWTTDIAGPSWVEYGVDGAFDLATPVVDDGSTSHDIAVIGMKAGIAYELRAVTEVASGRLVSDVLDHTPARDPLLPTFTISDYDPAKVRSASELFVVGLTLDATSFVVALDRDGDVVWSRGTSNAPTTSIQSPKIGRDGKSFLWAEWDTKKQQDLGGIFEMNTDGTGFVKHAATYIHHDFVEHPDGHLTWLTTDIRDLGAPAGTVLSDRIVEDAGDGSLRTVWSYFDQYPRPFWVPCAHAAGTENWGLDGAYEWTHTNSMLYDDEEDAYYLDSRFFDALLKIDGSTGDLLWQLGGDESDFTLPSGAPAYTGVDTPVLWSHGHYSHQWKGGFMMFDNGDHYDPPVSRVAEFAYDEEARTVEEVWSYERPVADQTFIKFLGDAKKLDNGNVVVFWSALGEIDEITPEGEVVWRLTADQCCMGRGQVITGLYQVTSPIRTWR